jgi:hypothetical protein
MTIEQHDWAAEDFLRAVLPDQGVYILASRVPGEKGMQHHHFAAIADLAAKAQALDDEGRDVFFAVASYRCAAAESLRRTQANAAQTKSFWLDIDCGPDKAAKGDGYATIEHAEAALPTFCDTHGLPQPAVVRSGGGLHCYWLLKESISKETWQAVANKIKTLAREGNSPLLADPARTADIASLLRPVGTINRKPERNSAPVTLVRTMVPISFASFQSLIETAHAKLFPGRAWGARQQLAPAPSATMQAILSAPSAFPLADAGKIVAACPNIREAVTNQAQVSEPWWRALIGVAKFCEEGDVVAHAWSSEHPKYDPATTQAKLSSWKGTGAATCDLLRDQKPELCAGCLHNGIINSPIVLGYAGIAAPTCAWPDPKSIEEPLPPVAPFDYNLLPDKFRAYVQDQAELMQAEPDFIAAPLMIATAATIGNRFAIAPKEHDPSWLVTSVLWGAIVGRSAVMKTPTMSKATFPLSVLETEMAKAFETRHAQYSLDKLLYDAAMAAAKKAAIAGNPACPPVEPEKPGPERMVANDTTFQSLTDILRNSPRGVLVLRDEVVALLETLSAEGQEGARGFYLEAWNGLGSYRVDRVGRGSFIIPRLAIWLCGGIQPGRLQTYVRQAVTGGNSDDGLLQRFQLLVWPDVAKSWHNVDRCPDFAATQVVLDTFKTLRALDPVAIGARVDPMGSLPAYLHFTTEAQVHFNAYRARLEAALRTTERHPALESHLAKYRSLVPALALVIHLVDGGTGPVPIAALDKAIDWSRYLWSHARRVYASVTNGAGFGVKALTGKITAGKLADGFTAREVRRHGWQFLSNVDDVRDALEWLVDAGWLRQSRVVSPDGGRPNETYTINPKVLK